MKRKRPKVSFVIRTKNEEKFIGKVLKLIGKQTFKNFEIIIVDSGSTDKTLSTVKKFPVELIKIKPSEFNYSYALNIGIKKAKGDFIAIVSGHSLPVNDTWLKEGVDVLKEKNVAGLSGPYTSFPLGYFNRFLGKVIFRFYKKRKDFDPWMTNTNSLIKKKYWQDYPFDEKLSGSEDYDWALEMLSRGKNIVKLRKFSVFHSHFLLGKPGYFEMLPIWRKWNKRVEAKKRPSVSFTRLKT